MHNLNRLLILLVALAILVPLGTSVVLFGDLRLATQDSLQDALERSKETERRSATIAARGDQSARTAEQLEKRLMELARKKRELRLKMADVLAAIRSSTQQADEEILRQEFAVRTYQDQRDALSDFARFMDERASSAESGPVAGGSLLRRILGMSLGDSVADNLRDSSLASARKHVLEQLLIAGETAGLASDRFHAAAGDLGEELTSLSSARESALKEYRVTLRALDRAERTQTVSEAELQEIKRITAEVEADILHMQAEMARIDGRLRAKAERELVQKGLREDRPERFRQGVSVGKGEFTWPALGSVSAGFHDAAYQRFFGVPHQGLDIVVSQGSPVWSASDGIVFITRPGGLTGYTYVLIGHRDEYATLYGHLSLISVRAGDQVTKGEQIGLSGGTPGTPGSGPMTTGPHLHFEVIVRGEHVDPKTVLP